MRRPSKYRNVPTVVDGVRFASKAEAARDAELQLLAKAGRIGGIKRQPRFPLLVNGTKICTYVGDWEYWELPDGAHGAQRPQAPPEDRHAIGHRVVEDRKGALTPAFKIKWALAKALHPEIEWRLS